ncbi:MAG: sulfotransferase [Aureisphaera sp.]
MKKTDIHTPDFIIVGTMKSGTTSLKQHLTNHKRVHLAYKELQFFSRKQNFQKGLEWYQEELTKGWKEGAKIIGEKTPEYAHNPYTPRRISESFPDVKLIWVFRNPIDRSYSNYMHNLRYGEEVYSFEKALQKEKRNKRDPYLHYLKRSTYHEQVQNFLDFFPKEQMLFVLFEDLIQPYGPDHVLNEVFQFLEVSPQDFDFDEEPRNKTILPRFPYSLYLAKKWGLTKSFKMNRFLNYMNFSNKKPGYQKLSQSQREKLVDYFKPHNEKLAALIGKDLSIWNQ